MKRKLIMAPLLLLTVIMQCSVFQVFSIASIKPNLLMIVTVSFALMCGRKTGLYTGFAGGLMMDLLYPGTLGFNALIYMWIGWACGYFFRIFYDDDIKTPLLLVFCGDFAYGLYCYILTFLLRGRIHFFFYLTRIIIPEAVYTLMMTLVLYGLLYRINKWLARSDKRSMDHFA